MARSYAKCRIFDKKRKKKNEVIITVDEILFYVCTLLPTAKTGLGFLSIFLHYSKTKVKILVYISPKENLIIKFQQLCLEFHCALLRYKFHADRYARIE